MSNGTLEERYLGEDFAEFFGAMQYLSGYLQQEMATALGVQDGVYSRWLRRRAIPHAMFDERFMELFTLTAGEIDALRERSIERKQQEKYEALALSYQERLLGAFVLRIETGPPLSDAETCLIQFLLSATELE